MRAVMKIGVPLCAVLLLLNFPRLYLRAQIPGVPAAPAAPAVPGVPGAPAAPGFAAPAAPAAPQPTTLWSFLGISHENCQKCRDRLCQSNLGKMLNSMLLPAQFASGNLIGPLCPPGPSAADLAKLTDPNNLNASPAEAAAAKIKADEATVKARIAAVRYLATVDCHYYPEAGDALIDSLRKDRNECVRYEAALALNRGCCCNKKTIAALVLVVDGKDTDGNPSETSERVKSAATSAISLCMAHIQYVPDEPVQPELPPVPDLKPLEPPSPLIQAGFSRVQLTSYYTQYLPKVPREYLLQQAGRILAEKAGTATAPRTPSPGQGGLLGMWRSAQDPTTLREEIPFDEAALFTPTRPVNVTPQPSPVRASLGFKTCEGGCPLVPTSADSWSQNAAPQPVPWPLGSSGKRM